MIRNVRDYAIFEFAEDRTIRSWNEGVREILGYDEEEWVGQKGDIIFTPGDQAADAPRREVESVLRDGCAVDDRWHVRKDGTLFWANGSVTVVTDESSSVTGFVKILQDRSRERQAQEDLSQALLRLDAAVESGGVFTWLWDLEADRISGSGGLMRLFGDSELEGALEPVDFERFTRQVHPDDRNSVQAAIREAIRGDEPLDIDFRLLDAEGEVHWLSVRGKLHRDPNGRPKVLTGVLVDISSQKADEELLRHLNELLNREYEALDYTVSHDLRSPLRSIHGFSQLLLGDYGDRLDEQAVDYLERISTAAARMGELIDALLELSRIPRARFKPTQFDLSTLVGQVAKELMEARPDRQVDLRIEPGVKVRADRTLLRMAVRHLLSNSLKFAGQREQPVIEFGLTEGAKGAVYYVRDNGSGFRMEHAKRLFAPFQRLHEEPEIEGLGVGLAIVRQVIERHRGRVWAESGRGEGSTFYFTLSEG